MTLIDTRTPDPKNFISGATGDWEIIIGLEVHAQVISKSKLFSGASTTFGAKPNANVSLVDAAMPGMLPVINEECVRQAVRTGLGLKAKINLKSVFDRKNYFYPDLPQGYQISQFKQPIVGEGVVIVSIDPDKSGRFEEIEVGIERLHLEQDAGKSIHDQHPTMSYVDLNRSGVALMEIVSKPDMRSADEAKAYVAKLRSILRYLGTCDGNMDEGSMRADVNVSVRKVGDSELGTRTETKNVNSVRFVMQTIEHEAQRQVDVLEEGGTIVQETRLFDPGTGTTRSMRSKEDAHDYRYFPDPDLLPLELDDAFLEECRASLPELPDAKRARYVNELGLTPYNARELTAEVETFARFETLLGAASDAIGKPETKVATQVANWALSVAPGVIKSVGDEADASHATAARQASILAMQDKGEISGGQAKEIFEIVLKTGREPDEIADSEGLKQVSDTGAIEAAIDEILANNEDKVEQYKGGKDKLFGFFVGQTMKAMQGKANPQAVNQILRQKLGL